MPATTCSVVTNNLNLALLFLVQPFLEETLKGTYFLVVSTRQIVQSYVSLGLDDDLLFLKQECQKKRLLIRL